MEAEIQKEPSNAGRKTKRTPEVEAKLVEALKDGCTRRAAAAYAGITESTLYDWINEFPEFSESLTRAENEAEAGYTRVLKEAALNGDWRAAESWLKRRRKSEWAEKTEVEHSGGLKIERKAADMEDDELATIALTGGD